MSDRKSMTEYGHVIPDPSLIQKQLALAFAVRSNATGKKLLVDNFAGGGGVSKGIEMAFGRPVDIAINHDGEALLMHIVNHPDTAHYQEDVFGVHPGFITGNRKIGLAWFSPDCTHHSKAKGGKPRSQKIRGLAWIALKWGAMRRPDCIAIENVPDLLTWGPLDAHGKPIKEAAGRTFRAFIDALTTGLAPDHPDVPEIHDTLGADFPMARLHTGLGYTVEWKVLKAHEYGVPQKRHRLFILCRCDGLPICWPTPTHGNPEGKGFDTSGLLPWKTAGDCIDFSLSAESLFDRPKELVTNTQRRVAKGIWRHVLNTPKPFIVTTAPAHPGAALKEPPPTCATAGHHMRATPFLTEHANASNQRTMRADQPIPTICAQVKGGHFSTVAPIITPFRGTTEAHLQAHPTTSPLSVVSAQGNHHAIVAANLVTIGYGEREGQAARAQDLRRPLGAVVTSGKHAVVSAHLTHLPHPGERLGVAANDPAPTANDPHQGDVAINLAFLEQANGGFYDGHGHPCSSPISTVTGSGSNQRLVNAYLVKYYSNGGQWQGLHEPMHTLPTKARMGLVQVVQVPIAALAPKHRKKAKKCALLLQEHLPEHFTEQADLVLLAHQGALWALVDITLRMLTPRELARAQGFPDTYILDPKVRKPTTATRSVVKESAQQRATPNRRKYALAPLSKAAQIRMIGNSVPPPLVAALLRANFQHELQELQSAA